MLEEDVNLDMYWDNVVKSSIDQSIIKRKLEYALSHNKRVSVSYISYILF